MTTPVTQPIEAVADELFRAVKAQYPEIEEINRTVSPEDKEHIWIRVYAPMDDDAEIELRRFATELEADILEEYGYRISIMPRQSRPFQ